MSTTPPKIPPLPLSPKHQLSVEKSKALDKKVESFLKVNVQNPSGLSAQSMEASSCSLSDARAFFQSEMKLIIELWGQSGKLYQEKETENAQLVKKVNECEKTIADLEKRGLVQETVERSKNPSLEVDLKDETKTRKKAEGYESKIPKIHEESISDFNLSHSRGNQNDGYHRIKKEQYFRISVENQESKRANDALSFQLKCLTSRYDILKQRYDSQQSQYKKCRESLSNLELQKNRLKHNYDILKIGHDSLQKSYRSLEDKHGKSIADYEVEVRKLRQLLRGIQNKQSPKKLSQKYQEGYYSINRPLNRNESIESFASSDASNTLMSNMSHVEINLKEENQYLRKELIRAFDDKGALQSKVNKYKKMNQTYSAQINQYILDPTNRKNKNQSNIDSQMYFDKSSDQIFKKNKNTSILVVQNTEMKQKELVENHKMSNLIKQCHKLLQHKANNEQNFQYKNTPFQLLQIFFESLKQYVTQKEKKQKELIKIRSELQSLQQQKNQLNEKAKKDTFELKSFLKGITQNPSQTQSIDSTDRAFENISLSQNQKANHISQASIVAKYNDLEEKEKENVKRIEEQKLQIAALKQKVSTLESMAQSFYRLTNQSQSPSHAKAEVKAEQIVTWQPEARQTLTYQDHYGIELSSFELFKQKLTEFYQHTISELNEWSSSIQKNGHSPQKQLPQLVSENFDSHPYHIPQIVQRNILKISQEFRSIKNSSFDEQSAKKNGEIENQFFKDQKLSQSFIRQEEKNFMFGEETLEDIINKKLSDFQQFSSEWIEKVTRAQIQNGDQSQVGEKVRDQTFKKEGMLKTTIKHRGAAKTDRPAVQRNNNFELDMNQIDAQSDSVTSSELFRERQVYCREQISFFVHKNDPLNKMLSSANSKRSYQSYKV